MAESMKIVFAKLNSANYFTWKYKMEMYLRKEKLWTYINNDPPTIPPGAAEGSTPVQMATATAAIEAARATRTTFDEKDDTARALIGLCVEDGQLVYIRNKATAKQSWNALKEVHERDTLGNKINIMRRICRLRMEEGADMELHVAEMTNLFQKLVDLGENQITDEWKYMLIMSSLPSSYDQLITALEARGDLTLSLVCSKLISEYSKRKYAMGESSKAEEQSSVLKTTSSKMKCFFCKRGSHVKKDCYKYKEWLKKKQSQCDGGKNNADKVNKVEEPKCDFLFVVNSQSNNGWVIDSGATSHVTNNKQLFNTFDSSAKGIVKVANNTIEKVNGKGTCNVNLVNENGQISTAKLADVLYAPNIQGNLISVKKLMNNGFKIIFDKGLCEIQRNDKQMALADEINGLFTLRQLSVVNACSDKEEKKYCLHEWHRLFGHRDVAAIKRMHKNEMIHGLNLCDCGQQIQCEVCLEAKTTRLPFPISKHKSKSVLEIIHTDVCGPMQTESLHGKKRYLLTLIDDYSKFTVVYFLRQKSETEQKIREYIAFVKNKFNKKPKILRSDRGGEYMSESLLSFLKFDGIESQFTAPSTPQQNGVAERKNRSLIEMARCLLTDANLPKNLWAEAVNTANYIQNRTITKGADSIPFELWNGEKANVNHFEIFGTKCYVHIPAEKRKKLENTAIQMQFVGYEGGSKAFRCYNASNRKIIVSRDVRFVRTQMHREKILIELTSADKSKKDAQNQVNDFNESLIESDDSDGNNDYLSADDEFSEMDTTLNGADMSYRTRMPSTSSEDTSESSHDSDSTIVPLKYESNLDDEYDELSTSFGEISIRDSDGDFEITSGQIDSEDTVNSETDNDNSPRTSSRSNKGIPPQRFRVNLITEPKTINEALSGKLKSKWLGAMEEEMKSLEENDTWELCELPKDRKAIDCKWVFKTKTDANENAQRFKARLVARGFYQKYGQDYDLVFAPVAKHTTIRILLSIASKENLLVHHFDVKTAFLNGKLSESIYMKQPPGFQGENKNLVCRLKKGIYGLKQAAKLWYEAIHDVLIRAGFQRSKADACLYSANINNEWVFVLIYVDDMAVAAKTKKTIQSVKSMIALKFNIQDLGEIKQYLGIEVERDSDGIFHLGQTQYIKKIVNDFGLSTAKLSNIPLRVDYGKVKANDDILATNVEYQKLLGSLLYISVNTRPDIAAAVSILAQKVSQPLQEDWDELKRVLKYLKGTANLKLALCKKNHEGELLYGYSDASWADNKNDRKSNSGHVFMVNGAAVCWSSRKQQLVALSTCEAEFIALSDACRAASWIRRLLIDMKQIISNASTIYEDNQSCLKLIEEEERLSDRSKHIDTRFHFVKDYVEHQLVVCTYCPTDDMVADILTKPLSAKKFERFRNQLQLHD